MTAINLSALKKNKSSSLLDKLKKNVAEEASAGKFAKDDEGFWQPTVDENGNGFAKIRFLPAKTEDGLPFVKMYSHGFKGPKGKWFIENCPTTLNQECPVCVENSILWNSGIESDKVVARERKRKMSYIANIIVITDAKKPECEGKVFKFKFGAKIFDKLKLAMDPPAEFGEEPRDPFAFFDGCIMKLKIRKVEGYRNYDLSEVSPAEDLFGGDEKKLEAILEEMTDLQEIVSPVHFKSFEELTKKFNSIIGIEDVKAEKELEAMTSGVKETETPFEKPTQSRGAEKKETVLNSDDDDFFKSLASDEDDIPF